MKLLFINIYHTLFFIYGSKIAILTWLLYLQFVFKNILCLDGAKKAKQARVAKGFLASSNAYMLVYTAQSVRDVLKPLTENDLQPHLLKQIQQSNDEFEKLILETKEEKVSFCFLIFNIYY